MRHFCTALLGIGVIGLGLAAGCSSEDDGDDDGDAPVEFVTGGGPATGPTGAAATGMGASTGMVGSGGMGTAATGTGTGATYTGSGGALPPAAGDGTVGTAGSPGTDLGQPVEDIPECSVIEGLGPDADECGAQAVEAQFYPVNVLLVMDKSGSMTFSYAGSSGPTRWQALKDALAGALEPLRQLVNVGLLLYPDPRLDVECDVATCCQMSPNAEPDVPIGKGTSTISQINSKLGSTQPGGATPTAEALFRAHDYYRQAAPEGDKYVILATDGGPNCNTEITCSADECTRNLDAVDDCPLPTGEGDILNCCSNLNTACVDEARTRNEIQAMLADDIVTIVVGIPGSEAYSEFLAGFGDVGGHTPAGGGSYYNAAAEGGTQGLEKVFTDIAVQLVSSCEIVLEQPPADISKVNVAVDCVVIPRGDPESGSGWRFDSNTDPTRIYLEGEICDTIVNQGVQRIDTVFGCATIF